MYLFHRFTLFIDQNKKMGTGCSTLSSVPFCIFVNPDIFNFCLHNYRYDICAHVMGPNLNYKTHQN